MFLKYEFVVVTSTIANLLEALPVGNFGTARFADLVNQTRTADHSVLAAYQCQGQSCMAADASGSTGRNPIMMPEGASDDDTQCVIKHNPVVGEILKEYKNQVPKVPKQDTSWMTTALTSLNSLLKPFSSPRETGKFTGTCAQNILIFAKGTLEPTAYGVTIGPQLTDGLPADWSTAPVDYDPDIAGDFCLGLPGGMVAKDVINGASQKCPNSKIFVSGYSQGAMVIRNGLARATDDVKKQVKGVITFGDPFDGAPIKGYSGPIQIYCAPGDSVCTGNFEVGTAHLSYVFDSTVAQAQKKLLEMASGGGDNNCCHPPDPPPIPSPEMWASSIAANGGKVPEAKPGTTIEQWANALSQSNGKVPAYSVESSGGVAS